MNKCTCGTKLTIGLLKHIDIIYASILSINMTKLIFISITNFCNKLVVGKVWYKTSFNYTMKIITDVFKNIPFYYTKYKVFHRIPEFEAMTIKLHILAMQIR
jgi:hypothetical protein